jgi:WD40 repeat protein
LRSGSHSIRDARALQTSEGQESATFTEHHDEIRGVAFSPDGRSIASTGLGADVKVWDAATGQRRARLGGDAVVFALAWHPDGQRLAVAGDDGPLFTSDDDVFGTVLHTFVVPRG